MMFSQSTELNTLLEMKSPVDPCEITAAVSNFPRVCMAVASCDMSVVEFADSEEVSGYSQSMSTPSRLCALMKLTMLFTNAVRAVELPASDTNRSEERRVGKECRSR